MLGNIETIRNIHDSPEKEGAQSEYNSLLNHEYFQVPAQGFVWLQDWGIRVVRLRWSHKI